MFKRAGLSVRRRKTKTMIYFIFLFIVSSLVLISISIKNATDESMKNVRKSLSTEVTLSRNMEKMRENFNPKENEGEGEKKEFSEKDRKEMLDSMHDKMNKGAATKSDVDTISSISYVNDVRYSVTVNGTEDNFSLYETSSKEEANEPSDDMKNDMMPGGRMNKNLNNNSLKIEGINTFKLQEGYVNGSISLVEGKAFDENDEDSVIISYELSTTNNLSIGDKISLKDSSGNSHELQIIGIYEYKTTDSFRTNYNKIYVNINTATKFMTEEEYNDGNYSVEDVVFYLDDPENSDKFIEEANKKVTDLEDRDLILDIDTESYERMVSSLEGVKNFSNIVLIVVVIASITIISLMVINSLKDRNYEIGVLLSFGEKKSKIIGQFIIELCIIAFGAFILSIGTAKITSQKFANILIENQIKTEENVSEFGRGDRGFGFKNNINKTGEKVEEIKEVSVDTSFKDIVILFILGYGIIIISMIIPSIKILNKDPKNILSRRE